MPRPNKIAKDYGPATDSTIWFVWLPASQAWGIFMGANPFTLSGAKPHSIMGSSIHSKLDDALDAYDLAQRTHKPVIERWVNNIPVKLRRKDSPIRLDPR